MIITIRNRAILRLFGFHAVSKSIEPLVAMDIRDWAWLVWVRVTGR